MQFSTRCCDLKEISYFTVLLSVEFCINVRMEESESVVLPSYNNLVSTQYKTFYYH